MKKLVAHKDYLTRFILFSLVFVIPIAWSARAGVPDPRYHEEPLSPAEAEAAGLTCPKAPFALTESGSVWLRVGGQARLRGEAWNNFGFAPGNDDEYALLRLRLHGDLRLGDKLRIFVEGKSALSSGRDLPGGDRPLDVDTLDLQNAFLEIRNTPTGVVDLALRAGRQELKYGKQRLVSPLDWANTRRTFDGFVLAGATGDWNVDLLLTRFVPVDKYDFNERDEDHAFYGAYAAHTSLLPGQTLDLYWLGREQGIEDRFSVGTRLGGSWTDTGFDSDVEVTYQYGDRAASDIDAYSVSAVLGYSLAETTMRPRFYAGYDYASGDKDADDKKVNTFNQLYPLGHAYLGYIDVVGRQNIQAASLGLSAWPKAGRVLCKLEGHYFRRAESTDALYNAGGGVVRPGDSGDARDVGTELDLLVKWVVNPETEILGGYSHFFAGDFIRESGPSTDIDFAYASVQYTF